MAGAGGGHSFSLWPNRSASFTGRDFRASRSQNAAVLGKVTEGQAGQETPFWAQPMAVGGSSAFSCFRERVKCSLGVNVQEKNRARLVLKATDHQNDSLRPEELKRILLEVRDAQDARWLLPKLRERPIYSHGLCAFKCLVVLQRVLQSDVHMEWSQLGAFFESVIDHWNQVDLPGSQLLVDYSRVLQSKMEMLDRDSGCGKFNGTFSFSRSVAEPSDLLQALAMLLNFSEKLMPLALDVTSSVNQCPYGRVYLGAIVVLLDEAWQLLCAVSVFVRDLLWQVHAAAKFGARDVGPEPPWLQLALHLLQAQPRFVKFHSAMCDFVSTCHELRSSGVQELAPPYVIPAVPQALLNLFADFKDLVLGYCDRTELPNKALSVPEATPLPNSQAAKVVASGDLSALSTAVGSNSIAGPSGPSSATSWPSAKVMDALRTVDSLQRSPFLAERPVQLEEDTDPSTKGYALLASCDEVASGARGADGPSASASSKAQGPVPHVAHTPSWAAAICRHRDERRVSAPEATAPLFSTPLWEGTPTPGVSIPQPIPKAAELVEAPSSEVEAPRPAAPVQVPPNPFAQIPAVAQVDRRASPRQRGPPNFVSPHGRPERSASPRFGQLPLKGEAPCSPQVRPRVLPGHAPCAAPVSPVPKANEAEDFSSAAEWEVDHTELRLEELLGTGSTAEVYRAGWHGTDVAVKKLRSQGQLSTEFKREISVLLRLRHPNLVLFMGACTKAPQALIISEFCAGGTIFALLHQRKDLQLPWFQRLHIALDVAKGMNFLHRRQVVHRDLKSLNLLLTSPLRSNEDVPAVKVSDFGLSRAFPNAATSAQQVCMTSGAGTYHWMAPEVLSGQSYDEKVDVYSYGICLYELITRRIPYDTSGLEPVSIAVAVSRGKRPDPTMVPQDCPADLRFTMKCCWAHRPSGRPGFDTILETLKLVKGCR